MKIPFYLANGCPDCGYPLDTIINTNKVLKMACKECGALFTHERRNDKR